MGDARTPAPGPGRPRASTREAVEAVAIELLLREGYANVTVDRIAAAAGIGRTTFFRYFPTKADVVWGAFEAAIDRLQAGLAAADPEVAATAAIRDAVVASTRGAVDTRGVWLDRFELLDTSPALRANAEEHWAAWRACVAQFVGRRTGSDPAEIVPMAVAGAVHGVYVAELRSWLAASAPPGVLLEHLGASLTMVGAALETLVVPAAA
jgi:AcrR family transcriptional regulator